MFSKTSGVVIQWWNSILTYTSRVYFRMQVCDTWHMDPPRVALMEFFWCSQNIFSGSAIFFLILCFSIFGILKWLNSKLEFWKNFGNFFRGGSGPLPGYVPEGRLKDTLGFSNCLVMTKIMLSWSSRFSLLLRDIHWTVHGCFWEGFFKSWPLFWEITSKWWSFCTK